MPANRLKRILLPFLLTLFILLLDQISKALIVSHIRLHTVGFQVFGDFLRIIHARNPGIAFSIGHGMGTVVRLLFFSLIPVAVLGFVIVFYIRTDFLTPLQRWAIAGVIGGGLGNIIDRIVRPGGVVDFIDIKFYGLFGLERWPTFNVADASVVVCGIILIISFIFLKSESEKPADE